MAGCDIEAYSEWARDHALYPRNLGELEKFNAHARITGPCGDTMEFWASIVQGKIAKITFWCEGCAATVACGSLITCLAKNKRVDEAARLTPNLILETIGGLPEGHEHCAKLAAMTLGELCRMYQEKTA